MAKHKGTITVICLVRGDEIFKAGDTVYYWDFMFNELKEGYLNTLVDRGKEVIYIFHAAYKLPIIQLNDIKCVSKSRKIALELTLSELKNIQDKVFAELQTLE